MQFDKFKLISVVKRPIPMGAQNMGSWVVVFELVLFLSILSNAGIIAYTAEGNNAQKNIVFAIVVLVLLLVRWLITQMINEVPEYIILLKTRQQSIIKKVINRF